MTAAVAEAVATEVSDGTYVLGIRHHGPGSARGVLAELDRIQPDVVLVEGPADADSLVRFVTADGMEPPVALLAYDATTPARAVFWPYAVFSPEWQALRWAMDHGALARFVDLPSGAVLAHRPTRRRDERDERESRTSRIPRMTPTSRPSSDPTRSPSWRMRRVMTIPSGGGTTSSSPVRTVRDSRPSPRRWPRCARNPTPGIPIATTTTRPDARRTCAPSCARCARAAPTASSWSAAPGTRRPSSTRCPPPRLTPGSSRGCRRPRRC